MTFNKCVKLQINNNGHTFIIYEYIILYWNLLYLCVILNNYLVFENV